MDSIPLEPPTKGNIREFFFDYFRVPCPCCRNTTRSEIALKKARKTLMKEIDVVELIRTHRFLNNMMTSLMSTSERDNLVDKNRYIIVNPD